MSGPVVVQHLTNTAYGFPRGKPRRVKPVALACVHITGNSKTAAYTDLHKAAQAERNYANRAGSNGPSAHLYVARDGWAIEAVDAASAAWSNGDVSAPHTANPGVARVLALRAKGYNANEGYWDEIENVGYGSKYPVTSAQKDTMAARIAARSIASGLPINRETVHGHWEINGVDRQNCPCPPALHEPFLADVIARARALLPSVEVPMQSFTVPPVDTLAAVKVNAWLYDNSGFATAPANIQVNPAREMPLLGVLGTTLRIVEYVDGAGKRTGRAYYVKPDAVGATRPAPVPPPDCSAATKPLADRLAKANERIWRAATDLGATPPAPI